MTFSKRLLVLIAVFALLGGSAFANGKGSSPWKRTEKVGGYTTKSGKHVSGYNRAPPELPTRRGNPLKRSKRGTQEQKGRLRSSPLLMSDKIVTQSGRAICPPPELPQSQCYRKAQAAVFAQQQCESVMLVKPPRGVVFSINQQGEYARLGPRDTEHRVTQKHAAESFAR